jgi:hypothetical protein
MIGFTLLFHLCVCDVPCQLRVVVLQDTVMSHCIVLPQSTVGLVSFAAGLLYLFTSVTDFCCMIQIDYDGDDDYINVDSDITFLYKITFSQFIFVRTQPLLCLSCFPAPTW